MRTPVFIAPFVLGLIAGCAGGAGRSAPDPIPSAIDLIRESEIEADLRQLAGDHFRGREAGTLDELKASAWLAERARQAGLEPGGDDGTYFQFWPIRRVRLSGSSSVALGSTRMVLSKDAVVLSNLTASVDAPLVMAGDGRPGSLEGVDLVGKVAVVRMSKPDAQLAEDVSLRQARYAFANLAERVPAVAAKRPAAVLLVADAVADSGWSFISNWFEDGSYGLDSRESPFGPAPAVPVIWLRESALPLVSTPGQRLTATLFFEEFTYPSVNVIARVLGTDPTVRGQHVLFSAHQDHDGVKEPVAGDSIWNGADDNATTSVALLAIGRAWARQPGRRSALFIWHGAEEKGLIGSRYHARNPVVPLDSITAVLNADMIGSNSPDSAGLLGAQPPHMNSRVLADFGLRANELVGRFVLDTLWDRPTHPEGWYFRSDHLPYAQLGVPALYFSSLPHPYYHTPLDDPSRINYSKLTRIARWMYATGWMVGNSEQKVDRGRVGQR